MRWALVVCLIGAAWAPRAADADLEGDAGLGTDPTSGGAPSPLLAPSAPVPLEPAVLANKLERLHSGQVEVRRAAAHEIAGLGPGSTDAVAAALAPLQQSPDDALRSALALARRASRGDKDELDALVEIDPTTPGAGDALTYVALLRALARADSLRAGHELVGVATSHGRALEREASKSLSDLGDPAVPALVDATRDTSHATSKWATELLESMGVRTAADAVQTKRLDVLDALFSGYARAADEGALAAILSFATSDKPKVRAAARRAIADYGPAADARLREEFQNLTSHAAPPEWDTTRVGRELFQAYDRAALADVYALLDGALDQAKKAQGDEAALAEATATFNKVLAREPDLDRRADMVPAYVQYAQVLEARDPKRARELFERALRLDPEGHRAGQIQSELAYLDAKSLEARGVIDREDLERAARLDPGNTRARDELARLDARDAAAASRAHLLTWAGAGIALALVVTLLFAKRRRS